MTSASWAGKAHPTSLTMLNNSTYHDVNAGGQWNCGNIRGYGAAPSYQWNQFCASCPPCTDDRFAVRLAYRDSWGPGCCTAESYTPKVWNWDYEPLTVNNSNSYTTLTDRILYREQYNKPFGYSFPSINDN
jgi:hypothetical protein